LLSISVAVRTRRRSASAKSGKPDKIRTPPLHHARLLQARKANRQRVCRGRQRLCPSRMPRDNTGSLDVDDAVKKVEDGRGEYNEVRPNSAIDDKASGEMPRRPEGRRFLPKTGLKIRDAPTVQKNLPYGDPKTGEHFTIVSKFGTRSMIVRFSQCVSVQTSPSMASIFIVVPPQSKGGEHRLLDTTKDPHFVTTEPTVNHCSPT
jgi:hypothetical protein